MIVMIEPCEICSAKDKEIFHMTGHIARLTQMMSQDHDTIQALMYELNLLGKVNKARQEKINELNTGTNGRATRTT